MRGGLLASLCVVGAACGGGDSSGPTTSHEVSGPWSYETRTLQDGHGATCSTTGSALSFNQTATRFTGSITGGTISCTYSGGTYNTALGIGQVSDGAITGDSIVFNIDGTSWHSVGTFVTADSAAGIVNAIYSLGGTPYILVGYWYARRQ